MCAHHHDVSQEDLQKWGVAVPIDSRSAPPVETRWITMKEPIRLESQLLCPNDLVQRAEHGVILFIFIEAPRRDVERRFTRLVMRTGEVMQLKTGNGND